MNYEINYVYIFLYFAYMIWNIKINNKTSPLKELDINDKIINY